MRQFQWPHVVCRHADHPSRLRLCGRSARVQASRPLAARRPSPPPRSRRPRRRFLVSFPSPGSRRARRFGNRRKPGPFDGFSFRRSPPRLERLAVAIAAPRQARPDRADARPLGRRARGAGQGRVDAAGRHHALLHEPARPARRLAAAATVVPSPASSSARPARPTIRWARTATARPRPGASLSRSRAAAGARLLLDLLPLLHAVARRRARRDHAQRGAAGEGVRLHPPDAGRFATC